MSLPILSASSMAVLLATTGLSSSIHMTNSPIEATGGEFASAVLISNSRGPNHLRPQIHQQIRQQVRQQIHQQSSLRAARSNQPYTLTVETTGRALNAELRVDGQTIKTLVNQSEVIDLSPHLSAGQHSVEISGTYSPVSATAQILLTGPGTQISQQVSGRGVLRQTLQISVQ
jgi:hypothetical protein